MGLIQGGKMDWTGCRAWPWVKHYIGCSCGVAWRSDFPRFLDSPFFLKRWWGDTGHAGFSPPGTRKSVRFVPVYVVVKLSRSDTLLCKGVLGKRPGATWHDYYNNHTAHTVLPWFSTWYSPVENEWEMLTCVRLPSWFKCCILHPGHLCLLSNKRGGFWEVCKRPGSERDE